MPHLPDHINKNMEGEGPWRVTEASLSPVVVAWRLSFQMTRGCLNISKCVEADIQKLMGSLIASTGGAVVLFMRKNKS